MHLPLYLSPHQLRFLASSSLSQTSVSPTAYRTAFSKARSNCITSKINCAYPLRVCNLSVIGFTRTDFKGINVWRKTLFLQIHNAFLSCASIFHHYCIHEFAHGNSDSKLAFLLLGPPKFSHVTIDS